MSSILKALKKLEEEKSQLQEEKEINVSREILKQHTENRSIVKWLWLFGSAATVVILVLAAALIRKTSTTEEVKSGEVPVASRPAPPLSQVKNLPESPKLTGRDKGAVTVPPLSSKEANPGASQQMPVTTHESSTKQEKIEFPPLKVPLAEPPKAEPATNPAAPREAKSGPALTLSGIAWNKDSADRLAIINGQPIATGGSVSGAVVDEILPDRVKLSHNGRIIELLIGRSARTD